MRRLTAEQYKAQRERYDARQLKREAAYEAKVEAAMAQFQAADTVWCVVDDADTDDPDYPIHYFLTKEDALIFHGDEVEEWLMQVPTPAGAECTIAHVASFKIPTDYVPQAPVPVVAQEAPQAHQAAQVPAQVPTGITQPGLFDAMPEMGEMTPNDWTPPAHMTYDQWEAIGRDFQLMQASGKWWLGAWLNEGEKRFGETYTQAIELTGHGLENLKKAAWVERNVKKEDRVEGLSWTHHHDVAHLPAHVQRALLAEALRLDLSTRELKIEVKNYQASIAPTPEPAPAPAPDDVPFDVCGRIVEALINDESGDAAEFAGYLMKDINDDVPAAEYEVDEAVPTVTPDVIEAVRETLQFIDYAPTAWREAAEDRWFGKMFVELRGVEDDRFFVERLIKEYGAGRVDEAITVAPNATNTAPIQKMLALYPACFLADHRQVVFYLGKYPAHFAKQFKELGRTVRAM
ncbi:MAG: hypothetical protein IPL32_18310 [Chloracidobacterium sp.]|nr:hypothetical protein [Chloracidobacterium sp.]